MTDSERLDRIIALLGAIALKIGARIPRPQAPPTDIDGWKQLNRELGQINRATEPDSGTGPPPAGGTPPETVFRRRDV